MYERHRQTKQSVWCRYSIWSCICHRRLKFISEHIPLRFYSYPWWVSPPYMSSNLYRGLQLYQFCLRYPKSLAVRTTYRCKWKIKYRIKCSGFSKKSTRTDRSVMIIIFCCICKVCSTARWPADNFFYWPFMGETVETVYQILYSSTFSPRLSVVNAISKIRATRNFYIDEGNLSCSHIFRIIDA